MQNPNDVQVGGDHYRKGEGILEHTCTGCGKESKIRLQHWDVAWIFHFDMFQYLITKYLWRDKGDFIEDLEKARHGIDKYIYCLKKKRDLEYMVDEEGGPTRAYVDQ